MFFLPNRGLTNRLTITGAQKKLMAALKTVGFYNKSILISRNFFLNDSWVYNLAVFFRYFKTLTYKQYPNSLTKAMTKNCLMTILYSKKFQKWSKIFWSPVTPLPPSSTKLNNFFFLDVVKTLCKRVEKSETRGEMKEKPELQIDPVKV